MTTPGDPTSGDFDEFYGANVDHLVLLLYAYTSDVGLAQDCVQEAFTRAWSRWKRLGSYENPAAWIRRVALNIAANRWRRARAARAHAHYHREQVVEEPSPDRVLLARALARIPERQRRALVLRYVADMSIGEIATMEDVAEGTVKSWLHRGRAALASQLIETDTEDSHA
ncbi:MAG TPA: SigE family RNA polymerase sigma factor [Micromonosporaceae bacterium]